MSSCLKVPAPPSSSTSSLRASRKLDASFSTGMRPMISALSEVAPSVPAKKKCFPPADDTLDLPGCIGMMAFDTETVMLDAASSRSTFSTASSGQFLKACTENPGPTSVMSKMCTKSELTLLCPKTFTYRPTWSDHPPTFLAKRSAAAFISSTTVKASRGEIPPSSDGTRPATRRLNHCQCRSFVVRKRWRRAIEAFDIHFGSVESQCRSLSGRFAQMRNFDL
mmetsp:Transcript_44132/g.124597  ORF Transcript_44132/g.124597 Transcript_44132/m.124597 type:complete len:223 (-) Transcript_44132:423-1091(-)